MLHGCDHKLVNYPRALACHMVFRALFTPSFSAPRLPVACLGSATHKPSGQFSEGWLIVSRSLGCSPDQETLDYTLGLKCRSCTLPSRESPETSTRWILPTTLQAHYQNFLQRWASSVLPNSPRNPMSEAPTWKSPHGPRVEASWLKLGFQVCLEVLFDSVFFFVKHILAQHSWWYKPSQMSADRYWCDFFQCVSAGGHACATWLSRRTQRIIEIKYLSRLWNHIV